jgi:hypothetical protein
VTSPSFVREPQQDRRWDETRKYRILYCHYICSEFRPNTLICYKFTRMERHDTKRLNIPCPVRAVCYKNTCHPLRDDKQWLQKMTGLRQQMPMDWSNRSALFRVHDARIRLRSEHSSITNDTFCVLVFTFPKVRTLNSRNCTTGSTSRI